MKQGRVAILLVVLIFTLTASSLADDRGRIYGKITTVDEDVFEGLIRWDKNEGSWVDFLNSTRELPRESRRSRRKRYKERTRKIFGISIGVTRSYLHEYKTGETGIRFGHIRSLEVLDDYTARLTLKSGETFEVQGGSTDIGKSIREIVVEDRNEGEIEFEWDDIERIDFEQNRGDLKSAFGERLYGTVTTQQNDEYTGWICWDVDELFAEDILDGNEKRRSRKIQFGKIRAIEHDGSSRALVILKNGDEMVLRGTNDVDSSNRGIVINDINVGQITVMWDEFERLELTSPPEPEEYDRFDGGHLLKGTVFTDKGDQYKGIIRWDDDEQYTWEVLDGEYRDVQFDIEFRNISEIKRKGNGSIVTLWDGTRIKLSDSNDVDDDNRGIFIELSDGREMEVEWDDFDRAEFIKR
ncbi:MAG: hypothetical protein JXB45_02340 [Candidatus Krumholzibacteriota bacterium]|nr:hypothetical protein [Candidatus Krumholzibacteriota bacterium]